MIPHLNKSFTGRHLPTLAHHDRVLWYIFGVWYNSMRMFIALSSFFLLAAASITDSGLVTYVFSSPHQNDAYSQFIYLKNGVPHKCYWNGNGDVKIGDIVTMTGKPDSEWSKGRFLNATNVTVIGHGEAPKPLEVDGHSIADAQFLHRTVSAHGVITDVIADDIDEQTVFFLVKDGDAVFLAGFRSANPNLTALKRTYLGTKVELSGLCTPHLGERYFSNVMILMKPDSLPRILSKPTRDPRLCPGLATARNMPPNALCDNQYHSASGTVLAVLDGGRRFLLKQGDFYNYSIEGVTDGEPLSIGMRVRVAGIPSTDLFSVRLNDCRVLHLGAEVPMTAQCPHPITADDLDRYHDKSGKPGSFMRFNSRLVKTQGRILSMPHTDIGECRMTIDISGRQIAVDLSCIDSKGLDLHIGVTVSVTGFFLVDADDWTPSSPFPHIRAIVIAPRDAADIAVVRISPIRLARLLLAALATITLLIAAIALRIRFQKERARIKTEERTHLAVELHDSLSQNLSGIALQLCATRTALSHNVASADRRLGMAERMIDSCRTELKRCLFDLRSRAIDVRDLNPVAIAVISPTIGNAALDVRLRVPRSTLDDTATYAILSILRELATNAVRHGRATRICIAAACVGQSIAFSVRDNGRGFDPDAAPGVCEGHFGLNGVRERLSRLGGKIKVCSAPGNGTYVRFSIPATRKAIQ